MYVIKLLRRTHDGEPPLTSLFFYPAGLSLVEQRQSVELGIGSQNPVRSPRAARTPLITSFSPFLARRLSGSDRPCEAGRDFAGDLVRGLPGEKTGTRCLPGCVHDFVDDELGGASPRVLPSEDVTAAIRKQIVSTTSVLTSPDPRE